MRTICCALLLAWLSSAAGQPALRIGLLVDGSEAGYQQAETVLKEEINALLGANHTLAYDTRHAGWASGRATAQLREWMAADDIHLVVTLGLISSQAAARLGDYPKPVIAGTMIDARLQALPMTDRQSSGVDNFTYVLAPYSFGRDLEVLRDIRDFRRLGILVEPAWIDALTGLRGYLDRLTGGKHTLIAAGESAGQTLGRLPSDLDAVYVAFLPRMAAGEQRRLFAGINRRGLPSFAMLGRPQVELGAMAGLAPAAILSMSARRIAIDVAKLAGGQPAADLPVVLEALGEDFTINMASVRSSGYYPAWDVLARARLINLLDDAGADRQVNLRGVIYEALRQNLALRIAGRDVAAGEQDIERARAGLRPQLGVATAAILVDRDRADASFGALRPFTWLASAELSQVIFSEPAYADVAIQKLRQTARVFQQQEAELDVVLEVAETYINILRTKTLVNIENENLAISKANLETARAKAAVGAESVSDVYRWESEITLNNIELNHALRRYRNAQYKLNQLLNHPLEETLATREPDLYDSLFLSRDQPLTAYFINPTGFQRFMRFMETEARRNLPELRQAGAAIDAQARLLKARQRALALPSVGIGASSNVNILRAGGAGTRTPSPELEGLLPPPADALSWQVGLRLELPILQGGGRRAGIEQARVDLLRLADQRADVLNQLMLRLRLALEMTRTSHGEITLTQHARESARKNFDLARDAYAEGAITLVQLLEAQQARLEVEQLAANAVYKFYIDYLSVERSVGNYSFLMNAEERQAFQRRLSQYMAAADDQ